MQTLCNNTDMKIIKNVKKPKRYYLQTISLKHDKK